MQERAAEQSATRSVHPTDGSCNHQGSAKSLKMKLPDGIIFNMSILSRGNTKEYLLHIVAVLCIIKKRDSTCSVGRSGRLLQS